MLTITQEEVTAKAAGAAAWGSFDAPGLLRKLILISATEEEVQSWS